MAGEQFSDACIREVLNIRSPGVFTIYTQKPEIPGGKSNGSRHSI